MEINNSMDQINKAGFVNIIGNPNVGKSTLMNALVGEKLSIVTAKAQTTRHRIMGIVNGDDYQIVFSDTPGILKPNYMLQESMMDFVETAIGDADIILYVTDVVEKMDKNVEYIEKLNKVECPVIIAINKIDETKQEKVVDISKIFDLDDADDFEISVSPAPAKREQSVASTVNDLSSNDTPILADAITPKTTLADTIAAPAALAEELTAARTRSLRQAIGINDKFLMTRDLFDGDEDAYAEAIAELDECETLDDCMIYIAENYEWNPDSEGAKFIMQLLERKHS